jgi:hypothetical protein
MEFAFLPSKVLKADAEGFAIINCRELPSSLSFTDHRPPYAAISGHTTKAVMKEMESDHLVQIIDLMGKLSAKAQDLKQPVTSYCKISGAHGRLYFRVDGRKVIGLLKVGPKTLFYRDKGGNVKEFNLLSVLDFYVHESMQRSGQGKVDSKGWRSLQFLRFSSRKCLRLSRFLLISWRMTGRHPNYLASCGSITI